MYENNSVSGDGMAIIDKLLKNLDAGNLADKMSDDVSTALSRRVRNGYDIDIDSRTDWRKKTEDGLKVAKQITETKSFPWKGAANVKYPLIATASIQFAARAYPQIVSGTDVVKAATIGEDPNGAKEARAKRISQHMSWQFLEQMPEWEPSMDALLHGLPVMGTYFKKTFFDPLLGRNRSISLTPFEVVVNMKHKGDLTTCRRITHELYLYKNEVMEREMSGLFVKGSADAMTNQLSEDENAVQELYLEQHCWYDLDGDGYEEPYIATVHYESGFVCRIVANYDETTIESLDDDTKLKRITKIEYFTKYIFIPDPEGDFYGIGFSHLLGPINESMSTIINQLLDAGSLANTGGGFISKGLRWQGGRLTFELGEWKPVDSVGMSLKDSILPMPVKEPSAVLFQLLGLLDTAGQKLAAVSDAMSGEMPSQNTPATTTLAMIEQGLKVFTAIYKRVFRSMKEEFKKMYRLNSLYMEETEYFRVLDTQEAIQRVDYAMGDMDVSPVADPTMSSEAQRLARANALMGTMEANPDPMGKVEILRQYYEAIGSKNIEKLLNLETIQKMIANPPPNPEILKHQLEIQKASDASDARLTELEQKEQEMIARILNIEADTDLKRAQTMKALADAEAVEPGQQLSQYKAYLDGLKAEQQHERELKKIGIEQEEDKEKAESGEEAPSGEGNGADTEGAPDGMAPPPSDAAGLGSPPPVEGGIAGASPVGTNLDTVLSGTNGDADYSQIGSDLRSELHSGIEPGSGG